MLPWGKNYHCMVAEASFCSPISQFYPSTSEIATKSSKNASVFMANTCMALGGSSWIHDTKYRAAFVHGTGNRLWWFTWLLLIQLRSSHSFTGTIKWRMTPFDGNNGVTMFPLFSQHTNESEYVTMNGAPERPREVNVAHKWHPWTDVCSTKGERVKEKHVNDGSGRT